MIWLFVYLISINLFGVWIMKSDKEKARKGEWRIPERQLWMVSFIGGATGAWYGMNRYRHKTQHTIFKYGLPTLSLIEIVVIFWLFLYIG